MAVLLQVGGRQWERVLEMVRRVRGLGMEVCTTLGMLTPEQARQLREAGLSAYNHNLDTSPEYYSQITTSRKYEVSHTVLYVACIPHQATVGCLSTYARVFQTCASVSSQIRMDSRTSLS